MTVQPSTRKNWIPLIVCLAVVAVASTNLDVGKKKKNKAPDVERRGYQLLKPEIELEPVEEYPGVQEIGGVRIELSLVPFELTPMYLVTVQERETTLKSWTGIVGVGGAAPVWIGALPFYEIHPENLQFTLRITNHLGRVLRLEGVAIQFAKDGEALETDYEANTLNKVIILPEKSWEGVLHGPPLEGFGLKEFDARTATSGLLEAPEIASEGVLLVGLYDVVTELDEASNATRRSNFEWVFGYTARAVPEGAEAVRWKAKLTEEQAMQIIGEFPAEQVAGMMPGNQ